jgi:putative transposase
VQQHLTNQKVDINIPKVQRRSVARTLPEYEKIANNRDEAIVEAYASGGYSNQEIGNHFGLHFTRVGKIVRAKR